MLWSKQLNTSVVDNIMWFIFSSQMIRCATKGKQGKQDHGMST